MYLFFDTETTGLPQSYNAPLSATYNWPRMLQLGIQVFDSNRTLTKETCVLIKPVGFQIPAAATELHGITAEKAFKYGYELADILRSFSRLVDDAECIIAHNIEFDLAIIGCEYYRCGLNNPFTKEKKLMCTMKMGVDICKIPGKKGYKWPKLSELYKKLFSSDFDGAHDALNDIRATSKCFFEMKNIEEKSKPVDFITLVEEMRHAQQQYFAATFGTLSKNDWLHKSKVLEKQVDAAIKEIRNPQTKLF